MKQYNPKNWYWIVNGSTTQVFSSASRGYVQVNDPTYLAWRADDTLPTRIPSEAELWDVLVRHVPEIAKEIPAALDVLKDRTIDGISNGTGLGIIFKLMFNLENRVRTLESRPTVTANQYRAAIKALL